MTRAAQGAHAPTMPAESTSMTSLVFMDNSGADGVGRHRLYFELDDERSDHPVMNRECPACGHGLPGTNPW
jgi:hypothetical protein